MDVKSRTRMLGLGGLLNLPGPIFLVNTTLDSIPKLAVYAALQNTGSEGRGSSLSFHILNLECVPSKSSVSVSVSAQSFAGHISPDKAQVF